MPNVAQAPEVKLFNVAVFMPRINWTDKPVRLQYGRHALNAAIDDHYGDLSAMLPQSLKLNEVDIVEVEVTGKRISKFVCRVPGMNGLDLVMVVGADGFVRTLWANEKGDAHKTLNRSRYATAL